MSMRYDEDYNVKRDACRLEGAIFMCNRKTKRECLQKKLFGLPQSHSSLVKQIKTGMILFLFEYEERKLYGVFEASSNGAVNIEPHAFASTGKSFGAQVRIKRIWNCLPLSEPKFCNAIKDNYYTPNKFHFSLSKDQVSKLILLFASRRTDTRVLESLGTCNRANEMPNYHRYTVAGEDLDMEDRRSDHKNVENELNMENFSELINPSGYHNLSISDISLGRYAGASRVGRNEILGEEHVMPLTLLDSSDPRTTHLIPSSSFKDEDSYMDGPIDNEEYIALPSSNQYDPVMPAITIQGSRYFEQNRVEPSKLGDYNTLLAKQCHLQTWTGSVPLFVSGTTDIGQTCYTIQPSTSVHPSSEAIGFGTRAIDCAGYFSNFRQDNGHIQPLLLQSADHYGTTRDKGLVSDSLDQRPSVFSRLSARSRPQDDDRIGHENTYESTTERSLGELMKILSQRRENWMTARKHRSSKLHGDNKHTTIENEEENIQAPVMAGFDDSDVVEESCEPSFLNFKRRSKRTKVGDEAEDRGNEQAVQEESQNCSGKQKRRKLVRPSFEKEEDSSNGSSMCQSIEPLSQNPLQNLLLVVSNVDPANKSHEELLNEECASTVKTPLTRQPSPDQVDNQHMLGLVLDPCDDLTIIANEMGRSDWLSLEIKQHSGINSLQKSLDDLGSLDRPCEERNCEERNVESASGASAGSP